jgi:hypothetical protein
VFEVRTFFYSIMLITFASNAYDTVFYTMRI